MALSLRAELLRENRGDPIEAAAIFALRLTRGDPRTLKAGYSVPSAILSALEIFPEVSEGEIRARNSAYGWMAPGHERTSP